MVRDEVFSNNSDKDRSPGWTDHRDAILGGLASGVPGKSISFGCDLARFRRVRIRPPTGVPPCSDQGRNRGQKRHHSALAPAPPHRHPDGVAVASRPAADPARLLPAVWLRPHWQHQRRLFGMRGEIDNGRASPVPAGTRVKIAHRFNGGYASPSIHCHPGGMARILRGGRAKSPFNPSLRDGYAWGTSPIPPLKRWAIFKRSLRDHVRWPFSCLRWPFALPRWP